MAKGLDELIDWLVAETAYCGETGFPITDFVAAVGRFNSGKTAVAFRDPDLDADDARQRQQHAHESADLPLARKAWEWVVERPEILVGRGGCRGPMTLDEALALPEPEPAVQALDDDGPKTPTPTGSKPRGNGRSKKVAFAEPPRKRLLASQAEDPGTRPRLYATEQTIWYILTGHDVDHKKIPPLEWKCLMGIAAARDRGILQGDLRALVDQDKRSVPKRTDFLAAKGYAVKRTTIARGYRTSMLWLTEFAPAELDTEANAATDVSALPLEAAGIDLTPAYLRKDLQPVPWRNRWLGDAIEFASFGQTILAIVKAWGVIRVIDLKTKLGIFGLRWQMRTLARACREFVESGILRFVAAMRADDRRLFKDCVKYERDPTPAEWAVYLAAGRRRVPMTEVRAKHRRDQERLIRGASESAVGDDEADVDEVDVEADDGEFETVPAQQWEPGMPGMPLPNLVYDTVRRAGTAGITSPEICRLTVGTRYARYMFSLINALARPQSQPAHLARFQLHCEPDRVGKNKAYLFRTLDNYRRAREEEEDKSESRESRDAQESRDARRAENERQLAVLHRDNRLDSVPASDVRRLFGFAQPPRSSAQDMLAQLGALLAGDRKPKTRPGRPRKADELAAGRGRGGKRGKRGRPPKVVEAREETIEAEAEVEAVPDPAAKRVRSLMPVAATHDSLPGTLTLDRDTSTLVFTYTKKRGRPKANAPRAVAREPLALALDEMTDPVLADEELRVDVGGTAYAFVVADVSASRRLLRSVLALRQGRDESESDVEAEPDDPTRRRTPRVSYAVDADADDDNESAKRIPTGPFVCETCQNVWKNLGGLQYHQTKSRSACNPDNVKRQKEAETSDGDANERESETKETKKEPVGRAVATEEPLLGFRGIAAAARVSSSPRALQPLRVPSPDTKQAVETPAKRARVVFPESTPRPPVHTPVHTPTQTSYTPTQTTQTQTHTDSSDPTLPPFRMPPLSRAVLRSSRTSIFLLRSLRTVEIIRYLVATHPDGVFPSDRALWYAVFAVYTKTFPGDDPPTMNVTKAALKKLEASKAVEEHTFGFRDARGQFIYCRLVARPGTDLFQSAVATELKQRIQAAYPRPHVPEAFAPTLKDVEVLRLLDREYDRATPRSVRGRRALAPEIEVLKAPVYEQPAPPSRPPVKTVLVVDWEGERQAEQMELEQDELDQNEKKRKIPDDDVVGALARNGRDGRHGSHGRDGRNGRNSSTHASPARKRRARFADFIAGKVEPRWARRDTLVLEEAYGSASLLAEEDDPDANIDPLLRDTRPAKPRAKPGPKPKARKASRETANPGLDSLPAYFFFHRSASDTLPGSRFVDSTSTDNVALYRNDRARPMHLRTLGPDGGATYVHFLPPNTALSDDDDTDSMDMSLHAHAFAPRAYKMVTKTLTLDGGPGRAWPALTETVFARHSDSSVTMVGWMPSAKSLVRANLPRSPAECAALLRGNHVLASFDVDDYAAERTPAETFFVAVDYVRAWEHSQQGADVLRNPSVAPEHVFLNVPFAGVHTTAHDAAANGAFSLWLPEYQYAVDTLPYAALVLEADDDAGRPGTSLDSVDAATYLRAGATTASQKQTLAQRDRQARQARQAKYVMDSRRSLTVLPRTNDSTDSTMADSTDDETLLAAFVAVRTLLGGLAQTVDWGLLARLYPSVSVAQLKSFWAAARKTRAAYLDKATERFQHAFLEAYDDGRLPPLDYDRVVDYDWPRLVAWTVQLLRDTSGAVLPATRAALESKYALVDMASATAGIPAQLQPLPSWREDYYHVARSVWNRLQDSAGEAAARPVDAPRPTTPAAAAAAMARGVPGARDALRFMVARSWIRALCGTPHDRYKPAVIKEKLLSLKYVGSQSDTGDAADAETNALLQLVIGNLTAARILRRSKSMVAVSGRMYQMAEVYASTLEKVAMETKFRQAWACKLRLDTLFRRGEPFALPANANDDGLMLAVVNLQAHGRVRLEAVDAPHVPFGFEPGNYETRKFPKHYQQFRQNVVPTAAYVYNDDIAPLQRRHAEMPGEGVHAEKPIWRDFFGVLNQQWFTRLTSAVVFSLATRGATGAAQTAAHLRPTVEPFEVDMIIGWAAHAGILVLDSTAAPGSATVAEWWWLLVGKMYTAVEQKTARPRPGRAVRDARAEARAELEAEERPERLSDEDEDE